MCLKQFIALKSDSQAQICGTCLKQFIAFWKRSSSEIMWTHWCMPETILNFIFEKRSSSAICGARLDSRKNSSSLKTILKWNIFVHLEQFVWILRKTILEWNSKYVACLVSRKRSPPETRTGDAAVHIGFPSEGQSDDHSTRGHMPGTIHRVEKRSWNGILLCAWNILFVSKKLDLILKRNAFKKANKKTIMLACFRF